MHQWVRRGILCALVVVVVILAYLPALRGGFVWDDDAWTTGISGLLQDVSGLRTMWLQPTALQQYYPLTGTTFWLDHQLWGLWTTPYHVENVLLHILAALLFWRLLLRLQLPGAGLAAALFALHPVMVESVAWITERKNVLSLVLYLGAGLAYLRFAQGRTRVERRESRAKVTAGETPADSSTLDARRSTFFYALALVLFLGALLAKTTAFSLSAALLLILWWRRGALRWRADVLPTLPFFALAVGLCGVTFWLEKTHVGAQGSDFELTFLQRCLVAGRVFWFYLGKLLWPAKLCFVYPRWQPEAGVWWQWLYPAGAAGAGAALWLARERIGRGPITALLFYVGTLFPVLGFMNAYFMRYSFVCDHWVYLSSLGIFALLAAGAARAAERWKEEKLVYGLAAVVLSILALLTWRQAGTFRDMETLWRATIAKNPQCWMAQNNLGAWFLGRGKPVEAETLYREALRLKPDEVTHYNLGATLAVQGKVEEAMQCYEQALKIKPDYPEALNNLGSILTKQNKLEQAIQHYERALELKPDFAEAHYNLGIALAAQGKPDEAIQHYEQALQCKPEHVEAHYNLGAALAARGRWDEAIQHYEQAVQLKPDFAEAYFNLGVALAKQMRLDEAVGYLGRALQLKPDHADSHVYLGVALAAQNKSAEAIQHFERALQLKPDQATVHCYLGLALAGQGKSAEAVQHFQQALDLATAQGNTVLAESIRARLAAYQQTLAQPQTP
jgi:protein O-mannosyl-transferase